MHPGIALVTYKVVQYCRKERVFDALDDLERSQWASPESIRQRQWEKLRQLVRHAYQHVPYYRSVYDAAGFRPEQLETVEDLSQRVKKLEDDIKWMQFHEQTKEQAVKDALDHHCEHCTISKQPTP